MGKKDNADFRSSRSEGHSSRKRGHGKARGRGRGRGHGFLTRDYNDGVRPASAVDSVDEDGPQEGSDEEEEDGTIATQIDVPVAMWVSRSLLRTRWH